MFGPSPLIKGGGGGGGGGGGPKKGSLEVSHKKGKGW